MSLSTGLQDKRHFKVALLGGNENSVLLLQYTEDNLRQLGNNYQNAEFQHYFKRKKHILQINLCEIWNNCSSVCNTLKRERGKRPVVHQQGMLSKVVGSQRPERAVVCCDPIFVKQRKTPVGMEAECCLEALMRNRSRVRL